MFHIEESEINQIRENADIVEIISSYIPLTQKGKNYFGVCPFHNDHAPSMSVSKEKGIFKCFSCGATGNVFKFVADFENIGFVQAVKRVAEKIGMNLKSDIPIKTETKHQKEYQIMELSTLFFQNNLLTSEGERAMRYLKSRGLNETIVKEFQIGLALDKNSLYQLLHQKKYQDQLLFNLGLINQNGLNFYDVFKNRIMFPIHNINGEPVGFTGRIYLPTSPPPKYLNSKETIIFKKGNILFNYHRAKDAVRLEKKLIIVEGNMDAIRMSANGFKNTIALMGVSLTNYQISEIKKLRVPVILMLDNDRAGATATYQLGTILEKEKIVVNVVRLSGEKDPDEYIVKNGIDAMQENLNAAISFLEFKLSYLKQDKNLEDSEELANYLKEVLNNLKETNDPILQDITLKKLNQEYNLSYDILKEELNRYEKKKQLQEEIIKQNLPKKERKNKYQDGLNHILYFMMNDSKYIKMYKSKLGFIENPIYRNIANEILGYYEIKKKIELADFLSYIETSKLKDEVYELIKNIKDDNMSEKIMEEYIISIKRIRKEKEIERLKEEQRNELDANKKIEIGMRIQQIKKEV
ncbi:MAG: DNA primase [Bacilli bacterium]|jgi:DNA primase|nr:DNA primase [Bacilli bacterium]